MNGRQAIIEMDIDGAINVEIACGTEVVLSSQFLTDNGFVSDYDAENIVNAEAVAAIISVMLTRKGYQHSAAKLDEIVKALFVPGGQFDPADYILAVA